MDALPKLLKPIGSVEGFQLLGSVMSVLVLPVQVDAVTLLGQSATKDKPNNDVLRR